LDLLGRKVLIQEGKALQLFAAEIMKTIASAKEMGALIPFAEKLEKYLQRAQQASFHLFGKASQNPEEFLADASLYLEYIGILTISWQWLRQGITVQEALDVGSPETDFYQGKLMAMRYFFEYELVKMDGLGKRLISEDMLTVEMKGEWF
jgi:butyryl-CoA dehydrogenase